MIRKAKVPIKFTTANGSPPLADRCIDLKCWEIDDPDLEPYILAGTPPVMSIGMRCNKLGYDFIWLGSKGLPPYYITPSGRIIVMEVIDDIPYIRTGSDQCQPRAAGRTVRVRAVPAPEENPEDGSGHHDLPDPTHLEEEREAPPTAADARDDSGNDTEAQPAGQGDGGAGASIPESAGGVPPPPPPAEGQREDAESRKRRNLMAEATRTEHLLTHKPFNPHCKVCQT